MRFLFGLLRTETLIALVGAEILLAIAFLAWSLVFGALAVAVHLPWWLPGAIGAFVFMGFYRTAKHIPNRRGRRGMR